MGLFDMLMLLTRQTDKDLREACGLDAATGELVHERGSAVAHVTSPVVKLGADVVQESTG